MKLLILVLFILLWRIYRMYTTRQVIRDHHGDPYLIRYFLYKPKDKGLLWYISGVNRIYLHHIIRSDYDRALHDHPWNFISIMLWGSYREIVDYRDACTQKKYWKRWQTLDMNNDYRDFKAPTILRRPAVWRHRLEIVPGQSVWTLVFTSEKKRSWGFWTALNKWCHWKSYDYENLICAEPEEIHAD